jgi:uroporphyrinogen-III decarboxylase
MSGDSSSVTVRDCLEAFADQQLDFVLNVGCECEAERSSAEMSLFT